MKNKLIIAIFLFIMATTTFVFGVFSLSAVNSVEPQGSISYVAYKARRYSNSTYTYYTSIQSAIETASDGDIIEVIRSHAISAPITVSKKITLMASDALNVSLTRSAAFSGNMLQVLAGGELNLGSSTVGYTGSLTFNGENRQLGQYGQPLIQTANVLKMYSGVQLINNFVNNKALAVNVASGTFYLYGGSIQNNKSNDYQNNGVVYLNNGTSGYFAGGSISVPDNTIQQYAIYSENGFVDVTGTSVYAQSGYNAIKVDGTLSATRTNLYLRNTGYVEGADIIKTYLNISGATVTKSVNLENYASFDVFSGGGDFDIVTSTNTSLTASNVHLLGGTTGDIYVNGNSGLQLEGNPVVGNIYLASGRRASVVKDITSANPLNLIPSDYTFGRSLALYSAGYTPTLSDFTLVDAAANNAELIVVGQEIRIGTTIPFDITLTPNTYVYNGAARTPAVTVKLSGATLTKDVDYSVSGDTSATNVGSYTINVTGLANYNNKNQTASWSITANPIALDVTLTQNSFVYTGSEITAYISQVKAGSTVLTASDYEIVIASSTTKATVVGTYTITVKGKGNYSGTGSAQWNITAKALTSVTFAAVTYNGAAQTPVATVLPSGATFALSPSNYTQTNAGTYTVTVVGTGNYSGTVSGSWTINTKGLTGTWAATNSWEYDGAAHGPTFNGWTGIATADAGNTTLLHYSLSNATATNVGNYTATASITGTKKDNYHIADGGSRAYSITAKAITAVAFSDATYNSALQTPVVSSITPSGALSSASYEFVGTYQYESAGTYTITIKGTGNYSGQVSGSWKINKANTIVVAWVNNTPYAYTGALQGPTASISSGIISGDTVTVAVSGQQSAVGGPYTATATLSGTHKDNYTISSGPTASFSIGKTELSLSWGSLSLVYNGTAQSPTVSIASGKIGSEVVSVVVDSQYAKTDVGGPYSATASLTGANANNYTIKSSDITKQFSITQKGITVNWTPSGTAQFTYNGSPQGPTPALSGIETVDAGSAKVDLTITNGTATNVGSYTASVALTGTRAFNYSIANGGTKPYSIIEASLESMITFADATYTYNATTRTLSPVGMPSGVSVTYVTTVTEYNPNGTDLVKANVTTNAFKEAGVYYITASFDGGTNYQDLVLSATLTINRAAITIKADNKTSVFGQAIVPLTWAVSSGTIFSGDDASFVSIFTITTTATPSSNVATYPITITTVGHKNYNIATTAGTYTITKATLASVTFNGATFTYDAQAHSIEPTSLPSGVTVSSYSTSAQEYKAQVADAYETATSKTTNSFTNAGKYVITAYLSGGVNYNDTSATATLQINRKAVTYNAVNKTSVYGQAPVALTYALDGSSTVYAGDVTSVQATLSLSCSVTSSSPVASYTITLATTGHKNYAITVQNGTYSVTKANITGLTFSDKSEEYNNTQKTITITGTVPTGTTVGYTTTSAKEYNAAGTLVTVTAGTNAYTEAGVYVVSASISGSNYNTLTLSATLTITRRNVTYTADNKNTAYGATLATLTYQLTSGTVISGQESSVTSTLSISTSPTVTTSSNVGNYSIVLTSSGHKNYNIQTVNGTYTVGKQNITGVTFANKTVTYNGSAQSIVATTLPSGTSIRGTDPYITQAKENNADGSAPTTATEVKSNSFTNAGTYVITVYISGGTNYNDANFTATLTINRATPTLAFAQSSVTLTAGNTATNVATPTPVTGGTVSYSSANTGVATVNSSGVVTANLNPSAYTTTITGTLAGTKNYTSQTATYTLTIQEAVAQVGTTYYTSISGAVQAAAASSTVIVIKSHTISGSTITIAKNLTILANAAVTVKSASSVTSALFKVTAGTVTFGGGSGILTFDGTDATGGSGAINIDTTGNVVAASNLIITKFYGGAFNMVSTITTGGLTINGGQYTYNRNSSGAVVSRTGGTLSITGGTFSNNQASNYGGVIYNNLTTGSFGIANATFSNNTANLDGGAIYTTGATTYTVTITSSTFSTNSSTTSYGGAIYSALNAANINFTITGSDFLTNSAKGSGGAIYLSNTSATNSSFTIESSNVEENSASITEGTISGAAIYTNFVNVHSIQTNYVDNTTASNTNGIAFYIANASADLGSGTTFNGNLSTNANAEVYGGAVYLLNATLDIDEGYFYNNEATEDGGAIYMSNTTGTIANSYFGTSEAYNGGALYITASSSIIFLFNEFVENTSLNDGSAIYAYNSTLSFTSGATFEDNAATRYATMYVSGGNLTLNGSTAEILFTTNTSLYDFEIYTNSSVINMSGNINTVNRLYINSSTNFVNVTAAMTNTSAIKIALNSINYTIGRKVVDFGALTVQATKFTLVGDVNFELVTVQKTLVVGSAQPLQFNVTSTLSYNGSAQSPSYTIKVGGITLEESPIHGFVVVNEPGKESVTSATNAGTYTIYVQGTGNYSNKSGSFPWTISPKSVTITLSAGTGSSGTTTGSWVWTLASNTYTQTLSATGINTLGTLPSPTKTGWTFAYWQTAGAVAISDSTIIPASNTTYNAKWNLNSYSISYNYAGGTAGAENPPAVWFGNALRISAPSKTGYTFTGWTLAGTNPDYTTAKYGVANDSITTAISSSSVKAIGSSSTAFTYMINLSSANGSVQLTATWTANTYTVTYNSNKPTTASATISGTTANSSHTYDTAKVLTSNGYSLTGWTFADWNSAADGSGTSYTNGQSVTNLTAVAGATVTLYAQWTAITYTVTYNSNKPSAASASISGTTANSTHTYDTAKALTSNGYSLTGWTFAGWNSLANGTGVNYTNGQSVSNLTTTSGATVTLYAKWTAKTYAITLNQNGATTNGTTSVTATYDSSTLAAITNPSKTGYTFAGWTITQDANDTLITTGGAFAASVSGYTDASSKWVRDAVATAYAKWTIISYTLTLKSVTGTVESGTGGTVKINSGSEGASATSDINYNTFTTVTATASTGYSFVGWYTTITGGTQLSANAVYTFNMPASSVTRYARFEAQKQNLSYDLNHQDNLFAGTFLQSGTRSVVNNEIIYTQTIGGTTVNYNVATGEVTLNGDFTQSIYFGAYNYTFTENDTYKLTVEYVSGTVTGTTGRFVYDTRKDNRASLTTRWNIETNIVASGSESATKVVTAAAASEGTMVEFWMWYSSARTFTNYKFKYSFEKVISNPTGKEVTYDAAYGTLESPTRTGYTFAGWYDNKQGTGTQITAATIFKGTSATTIYAKWTPKTYAITLNQNSATTSGTTSVSATFGSATLPSITNPTRTGYAFDGWTITQNGIDTLIAIDGFFATNVSNYTNPDGKWIRDGAITLYAKWTANTYTIAYNSNKPASASGTISGTTASSTHTYDVAKTLTSNGYSLTGWTFAGWNSAANGSGTNYTNGQSVTNLTATSGATVTLYAKWTANTYTVTYNSNKPASASASISGTTANSSHTYDTAKVLTSNGYSLTGWSFANWNTAANGTGTTYTNGQSVSNLTATSGATVTLYAQWTIVSYTITYTLNGGSWASGYTAPATYTYEASVTLPTLDNVVATNSVFAGWYENADLSTGGVKTSIPSGTTGNKTYYAKWDTAVAMNDTTGIFYKTLEAAVSAVSKNGDTILLIANTTVSSQMTINYNMTIKANTAYTITRSGSFTASMFVVNSGKTLTFGGGTAALKVDGNNVEVTTSGAVFSNSGTLNIQTNSTFTRNYSVATTGDIGGGVVYNTGTLNITGGTFGGSALNANYSLKNGGVIYNNGGSVAISGSTSFTYNYATSGQGSGGVLYSTGATATTTISGTPTFSYNTASNGGAIVTTGGASIQISGGTFTYNSASSNSGALQLNGSSTISNGTFSNNTASAGIGGAIRVPGAGTLTLSGGIFNNNAASSNGGAIALENALNISGNPSFSGNTQTNATITSDIFVATGKKVYVAAALSSTGIKLTPAAFTIGTVMVSYSTELTPSLTSFTLVGNASYKLVNAPSSYDLVIGSTASMSFALSGTPFTYDGTAKTPTLTVTVDGVALVKDAANGYVVLNESGKVSVASATNAGTYTIYIRGTGAYSDKETSQTWTINQRAITVTAENKTKTYGSANPSFTYTISSGSLASGHTATVPMTTTATTTSNVGTYTITVGTVTISSGSDVTANYSITKVNGTLTITPKVVSNLTVTLSSTSVVYNGLEQTVSVSSVQDGATALTLTTDYTVVSGTAGTTAGTYTVTVNGAGNYAGSTGTASWTITAKAVTITWTGGTSFTYNGSAQGPDYTQSGIVASDTTNGYVSHAATAKQTAVGSYTRTVTLSGTRASSYTLTNASQSYSITKASTTLTMSASTLEVFVGQTSTALTATLKRDTTAISGASITTNWTATSNATVTPSATNASGVSTLTIVGISAKTATTVTVTFAGDANHNTATATFTLTITQLTLTINASTGGTTALSTTSTAGTYSATSKNINVSYNSTIYIFASAGTGYAFGSWTKSSGTGTLTSASTANTTVTSIQSNVVMTVSFTANALTFANASLTPNATYQTTYTSNAFPAATNGTGTYTYSVVSGAVPELGLSSATKQFSGVPTANAGTYYIVVRATDSNSLATADATMTLVINKANQSITMATDTMSLISGNTTTRSFTVSPATGGGTISVSSSATGVATVTNSAGILTITGVAAGTATITVAVAATTNYNAATSVSFTVNVSAGVAQNTAKVAGSQYYGSIASAVSDAAASNTILVVASHTITDAVTINKNLTIQAPTGVNVTVTRGASFTASMFTINSGYTLTFGGGTGVITIDGNNVSVTTDGGVFLNNGTLTISSGTFTKNKTTTNGGVVYSSGTVTVTVGTFTNNNAQSGGVFWMFAGPYSAELTIHNGLFTGNSASYGGVSSGSIPTINNGIFKGNSATSGGVFYGSVTINGGTFGGTVAGEGNTATNGAVIYNENSGGTFSISGNPSFIKNSATTLGGAIYYSGGGATPTITGTPTFTENVEISRSSYSDIYLTSGRKISVPSALTVSNPIRITSQTTAAGTTVVTFTTLPASPLALFAMSSAHALYVSGNDLKIETGVALNETKNIRYISIPEAVTYAGDNDIIVVIASHTMYSSVTINKNLTIKSNSNVTLLRNGYLFSINSSTSLTFGGGTGVITIDGSSTSGYVFSNYGTLIINTINLINNVHTSNMFGPTTLIYNRVGSSLTINGGTFSSNTVGYGLIYSDSSINITGGIFSSNTGRVIYNNSGTVSITGGTFKGNTADTGGVIYNAGGDASHLGTLTITGGIFGGTGTGEANIADSGGVIYNSYYATATISNAQFIGNKALDASSNGYGGVIYNAWTVTINSGSFTSNTSGYLGGVIYNTKNLTINDGIFKSNGAVTNGGVVYNDNTSGNITITGGQFGGTVAGEGNSVSEGFGGVISNDGGGSISLVAGSGKTIRFYNNTSGEVGDDIYSSVGFNIGGNVENNGDITSGGSLTVTATMTNTNPVKIHGPIDGTAAVIFSTYQDGKFVAAFPEYILYREGNNLYLGEVVAQNQTTSTKYAFISHAVAEAISGDTILVTASHNITKSVIIDKNITIKANYDYTVTRVSETTLNTQSLFTINSGYTLIFGDGAGVLTIDGNSVTTTANGSVFANSGTLNIKAKTSFINNIGKQGGVIYNTGTLDIVSSTFSNNTATGSNYQEGIGGVIYNSGTATINSGTYSNNSALGTTGPNTGGGVIFNQTGTLYIKGGTFFLNSAANRGGVLNNSGIFEITGGTFGGDSASFKNTSPYGGVIYNQSYNQTNKILGGSFKYNTSNRGGVIYNNATGTSDLIIQSPASFTYNSATNTSTTYISSGGGVIINFTSKVTINSGTFSYNSAVNYGGVINNMGEVIISSGTFTNNSISGSASDQGGSVFHNKMYYASGSPPTLISASMTINNGTFSNNTGNSMIRNDGNSYTSTTTTLNITGGSFSVPSNDHIYHTSGAILNISGTPSFTPTGNYNVHLNHTVSYPAFIYVPSTLTVTNKILVNTIGANGTIVVQFASYPSNALTLFDFVIDSLCLYRDGNYLKKGTTVAKNITTSLKYDTLQNAITAVSGSSENIIGLLQNVTLIAQISIGSKNIVLKPYNTNVSITRGALDFHMFSLSSTSIFTIDGNSPYKITLSGAKYNNAGYVGILNTGGNLTINDGIFSGHYSNNYGAVFRAVSNATTTINGGTFQYNVAQYGGIAHNQSGSTLKIYGGIFQNNGFYYSSPFAVGNTSGGDPTNFTSSVGGAFHNSGSFLIYGGTFRYNSSKNNSGGAIWNNNSLTLSVGGTILFEYNYSSNGGGAISNDNGGYLAITGSGDITFSNNQSDNGGAILNSGSSAVAYIYGGTYNSTNYSSAGGGNIVHSANNAQLTITGGTWNAASGGTWYSVYIRSGSDASISTGLQRTSTTAGTGIRGGYIDSGSTLTWN